MIQEHRLLPMSHLLLALPALLAFVGFAAAQERILYNFGTNPGDGSQPYGNLLLGSAGEFYGTTIYGGNGPCSNGVPSGCGVVYELTPTTGGNWTETVLYRFPSDGDSGSYPVAGLIPDQLGNLYGVTAEGGSGSCESQGIVGCGTVFELSPPVQPGGAWTETVLYNFQGGEDGSIPEAALIFDTEGNLYGTTVGNFTGTAFELSPPTAPGGAWTETTLYSFGSPGDGAVPGQLVLQQGNLYGITNEGGIKACDDNQIGCGIVFELSPPSSGSGEWTETILYFFGRTREDGSPSFLVQTPLGALVGGEGEEFGPKGLFALSPLPGGHWAFGEVSGISGLPYGVAFAGARVIYGTTLDGGVSGGCSPGCGTIFKMTPAGRTWIPSTIYDFQNNGVDGLFPGGVILHDGALYGVTEDGGQYGAGTFFRYGK